MSISILIIIAGVVALRLSLFFSFCYTISNLCLILAQNILYLPATARIHFDTLEYSLATHLMINIDEQNNKLLSSAGIRWSEFQF